MAQRRADARSSSGAERSALAELVPPPDRIRWSHTSRLVATAVAVGLVALIGIGGYQALTRQGEPGVPVPPSADGVSVREGSHRLSVAVDAKVTLVEFVDFECEVCSQDDPSVEQVRADYGDRVTFVIRYFPSESHVNGQRAARAVEAAAEQGRFQAMYTTMVQTQDQWSGQQEPQDRLFRSYADELGLDMKKWDAAYGSDATWARIQADIDDGLALDVTATPGFFLNGDKIKPKSAEDLREALDQALAR